MESTRITPPDHAHVAARSARAARRARRADGRASAAAHLAVGTLRTGPRRAASLAAPTHAGVAVLPARPQPRDRALETDLARARRHILIVEDDARTAAMMRAAFELEDTRAWSVAVATDGVRALELAALTTPHLVLLDLHLPGLDGAEVYRQLRARPETRGAHVLFLSAATSIDLYHEGIENGVLLRKPFDMRDLMSLAHSLLGPDAH